MAKQATSSATVESILLLKQQVDMVVVGLMVPRVEREEISIKSIWNLWLKLVVVEEVEEEVDMVVVNRWGGLRVVDLVLGNSLSNMLLLLLLG